MDHGTGSGGSRVESCSNCGADDVQAEKLGFFERMLRWLRLGRPAPRARLTCRNCGSELPAHGGARIAMLRSRPSNASWWGAPIRFLRVLLGARTAIPAPIVYLAAALVGAVLGALLDLAAGWPWWIVALGAVAVVWVLFLMTALKAPGQGVPETLSSRLHDALSPKGAVHRWQRRQEQLFRTPPFPLYGLSPSWQGHRFLGGMGGGGMGRDASVNRLELAHGDPSGSQLRVSSSGGRGEAELPEEFLLQELAEQLWREVHRPPPDLSPDRFHEWLEAEDRERRMGEAPPFGPVEIPVEGEPVRFAYLAQGSGWVALGRRAGVTISLLARNLDVRQVELVTVRDVEPYIEGSRRLHERWEDPPAGGESGSG